MKTSNDFSEALMLFYESCHGGDRVEADRQLAVLARILNQGGASYTLEEVSAALLLSGAPRLPPTAGELLATLAGNRAMAQEAERELVF
jgi:hypothetical protein